MKTKENDLFYGSEILVIRAKYIQYSFTILYDLSRVFFPRTILRRVDLNNEVSNCHIFDFI
jgi:hypothetical protein